jgi:hypothetical protein
MKSIRSLLLLIVFVSVYGCAYSVPTTVSPAVNIYSSYEEKIPGTVVLVMDDSIKNVSQEIKASSYVCSAHTFPIRLDSALSQSIRQTTEAMFENVIEQNNLPTKDQLAQLNGKGVIYVKLNRFSPRISFSMGFWSSHANSNCDVVLDITVKDNQNKNLLVTSVSGSRTADGDGGGNCSNGANVLSDAISQSIRDAMERYAERLSNSEKVRTAFTEKKLQQNEQTKTTETKDIKAQ